MAAQEEREQITPKALYLNAGNFWSKRLFSEPAYPWQVEGGGRWKIQSLTPFSIYLIALKLCSESPFCAGF